MKTNARSNLQFTAFTVALLSVAILPAATATTPQYQIYDIGVVDAGDDASQGFGVSHGGIALVDQFAQGEVRRLPGHSTAALLACQILRDAVTQSRTARLRRLS